MQDKKWKTIIRRRGGKRRWKEGEGQENRRKKWREKSYMTGKKNNTEYEMEDRSEKKRE